MTKPSNCPFCDGEMQGDADYWWHPTIECVLSEFEFDGAAHNGSELELWERRAHMRVEPDLDARMQQAWQLLI